MSPIPKDLLHLRLDAESVFAGVDRVALSQRPAEAFVRQLEQACMMLGATTAQLNSVRHDAASSLIPARALEHMLSEVMRDEHGPRYAERWVPMETGGVPAWAETYLHRRITRFGMATYVRSADMPEAAVEAQEIPRRVHTIGIKFGYTWFEMQQAAQAGVQLDNEKAWAAREGAEDARNEILLRGDAALPGGGGIISTGLINDPTVPRISVAGATWANKQPDDILADVRTWLATARSQSRRRVVFDTLLLPEAQLSDIETRRLTDTGISIRKYLLDNVEGLREIGPLPDLAGAGQGGTDRALFYGRTPRIVRAVVPMLFQFLNPHQEALALKVFGVERIAGTEWRRPFGGLYADGI